MIFCSHCIWDSVKDINIHGVLIFVTTGTKRTPQSNDRPGLDVRKMSSFKVIKVKFAAICNMVLYKLFLTLLNERNRKLIISVEKKNILGSSIEIMKYAKNI